MPRQYRSIQERLDRFIDRSGGPDACWPWTGSLHGRGRPQFHARGRTRTAQIVLWEEANGPVPPGLDVLHTCDNGICMNLRHLYTGTHQQNMNDMIARGRAVHPCKIPDRYITEIRALAATGVQQRSLARAYGVSEAYVSMIVRGLRRPTVEH